ncbi:MAG TPA: FxsB family cyclophane-forming radical SAM/SPASM peptide maturase, partial [Actinospica sp.]|nr:FxsB family cyclophane-forming radical SAM/SPASM peptide maturase [Actinospica sp.]
MTDRFVPFRQFVIKVHSRCDLACRYCYVYEHADQSWRGRPRELDAAAAAQVALRMAEHAAAHALPELRLVLHGGEPLLLGHDRMRETLEILTRTIAPVAGLDLRIHTNAVRLDEEFLELFAAYEVKIGVSLDGDRVANDRHRLHRSGRSSYDQVLAALERLRRPAYRHLYAGLLCTIDISNDPVAVYRGLLAQEPPRVDLLLPHATWEHQPYHLLRPRDPEHPTEGAGEYAHWLGAIFEAWDADGRPVPIRTFESVLGALYGRPVTTETLGLDPVDLLVIETDGTLEQVDALKTAYEGAAATGLDVWRNSLDEAATVPGIAVRQQGIDGVSAVCRACDLVRICGGGHYPHRYRPDTGFDNPSVYCADLKGLITQVREAETAHGRGLPAPVTEPAVAANAAIAANESAAGSGVGTRVGSTAGSAVPSTVQVAAAGESAAPESASGGAATAADGAAYDGLDLRDEDLDGLVAGYGSAAAIGVLARNQAALRRNLLALIARQGPQQDKRFAEAWNLLAAVDNRSPEAVATVLAHPYVRTWAVQLLLDLRNGTAKPEDVHHLEAVAAAAALRAGSALEVGMRVPVPVRDGVAPLPGLGSLTADDAQDRVWCAVETSDRASSEESDGAGGTSALEMARPLRRIEAAGLTIALEDTDPYRECHGHASARLSEQEAEQWRRTLPAALTYVDEHL